MKDDKDHHKWMQDILLKDRFDLHVVENDNNLLEVEVHGD